MALKQYRKDGTRNEAGPEFMTLGCLVGEMCRY